MTVEVFTTLIYIGEDNGNKKDNTTISTSLHNLNVSDLGPDLKKKKLSFKIAPHLSDLHEILKSFRRLQPSRVINSTIHICLLYILGFYIF